MYFVVLSGSVVGCTTLSVAPMLAHSVMVCRVCSSILCLKVGTLFRRSTQPSNFNALLCFQSWFAEFLDFDNVLYASCESHFHWKSSRCALILCCVSCRTWCFTFCLLSGVILSLEQKKLFHISKNWSMLISSRISSCFDHWNLLPTSHQLLAWLLYDVLQRVRRLVRVKFLHQITMMSSFRLLQRIAPRKSMRGGTSEKLPSAARANWSLVFRTLFVVDVRAKVDLWVVSILIMHSGNF